MSWSKVALGEVCEFKYGKSLPKKSRVAGDFHVFGSNGKVGTHTEGYTDGSTIIVGRKGSVGEVNWSPNPCWPIDTTYFVDGSATKADLRYLYHILKAVGLNRLNKATGIPGLNRNDAYEKEIPLPPLEEQRRIAAILDKADELRRLRRRSIERLDTLAQSIFYDMFGDTGDQTKYVALGDVCDVRDGTHDSPKYVNDGFYLLTSKNFSSGEVSLEGAKKIGRADYDQINRRSKVDIGDIVMPMIGTIGSPVIIREEPNFAIKNVALVKFEQSSPRASFVHALLSSVILERIVRKQGRGGTQKFLSLGDLRRLKFHLPESSVQEKFEEKVSAISTQRMHSNSTLAFHECLFASLQQRAFRGEL